MTSTDLARRATACKGWRWLPGMRLRSIRVYLRVVGLNGDGSLRLAWDDPDRPVEGDTYTVEHIGGALPDLTDPCTLGGLLALVRDVHSCSEAHVYYADLSRLWVVRWGASGAGIRTVDARSEAEALVAALEAAP